MKINLISTRIIFYGLFVFCLCLLNACGFHLRGSEALPVSLQHMALDTPEPYSNFTQELTQSLKNAGASINTDAPLLLKVLKTYKTKQITTISANTNVRQYLLSYTIEFELRNTDNGKSTKNLEVSAQRPYTSSANQALGSSEIEATSDDNLRRNAIHQLIYRIQSEDTLKALQIKSHTHT